MNFDFADILPSVSKVTLCGQGIDDPIRALALDYANQIIAVVSLEYCALIFLSVSISTQADVRVCHSAIAAPVRTRFRVSQCILVELLIFALVAWGIAAHRRRVIHTLACRPFREMFDNDPADLCDNPCLHRNLSTKVIAESVIETVWVTTLSLRHYFTTFQGMSITSRMRVTTARMSVTLTIFVFMLNLRD
jgi:hypothetical protein